MAKRASIDPCMLELLKEKAAHSPCTYRISAIAFDKRGNVLGHVTNSHSKNLNVLDKCGQGREGTGLHAERKLFSRYKDLVKTIVICRIGRNGKLRPIDPCPVCQKVAAKYGATIVSVLPSGK